MRWGLSLQYFRLGLWILAQVHFELPRNRFFFIMESQRVTRVSVPFSKVEEMLPPGNCICRNPICYLARLPRWCCRCQCKDCGKLESDCDCIGIDPYDVYPLKVKPLGEKDWHCFGHRREFIIILKGLMAEVRETVSQ